MVDLANIQTKIRSKIIADLGSSATRKPFSSQTEDKWGDATVTYGADDSITVVPWNYVVDEENYQPFGNLQAGEIDMALRDDQEIDPKDLITFNSQTFIVKKVETPPLQDGFVLKVARFAKQY